MYNPPAFRENDHSTIRLVIERYPLATVVTSGAQGLIASHLPLLYAPDANGLGVLRGHMARANPQWREHSGREALVIFQGPDHYISPRWYPSKQEHGKVVPTWNYVAVHAHGTVRFPDDPAWLLENVRALSSFHEQAHGSDWKVDDAPPEYISGMLRAIVGFEMVVQRIEGKFKASQNRSAEDRQGVVRGLERSRSDNAQEMAKIVRERCKRE